MYEKYFIDGDVKPEFRTEYISLWPHWLGKENCHLRDKVTEFEWKRFNSFIEAVSNKFKVGLIDISEEAVNFPSKITSTFSDFHDSQNQDASLFSKYLLPELGCLITEEFDFTYILWHRNNGALEALRPLIIAAELQHFSDRRYG